MVRLAVAVAILALSGPAWAKCSLDRLVGYTLIAAKPVAGYYGNGRYGDDFEGCEWGRVLVFDDNTGITCQEYRYSYAYRPTAYIFSKDGIAALACINDELYQASLIVQ